MQKKLDVFQKFESIHKEVTSKIEYIKKLEIKALQYSNLIDEKESTVNSLRQEVNELKEQNHEYNEIISECTLEAMHYGDQTTQLLKLIETLDERIKKFYPSGDGDDYDLPDEINSKINKKIDKIINMVSFEYTRIRKDKIMEEFKQLHEANKILRNEIRKLDCFPKDWTPDDEINNITIEECEMRYAPDDDQEFQSLDSIPIPISEKSPNLMEDCCAPMPIPLNNIEPLQQKIDDFVQSQVEINDFINSSYESQAEYLKAIKNELNSKSISEEEVQQLQYQYQNQVQQMNEFTGIQPIEIPEIPIPNNNDQSFQAYTEKFSQFCQQINEDHPYKSLSDEFISSAEDALYIPQFEEPPTAPYVKRPVPSADLVKLADSLKDLIKSADKIESLKQIQENVSLQHKIFLENATKEENENTDNPKSDESDAFQINLPRPLSPPPENLTAIEFRELVKSKLPDMFHSIFETQDSDLFVETLQPQDETKPSNQPDESHFSESINSFPISEKGPQISMNAEERTHAFQEILKDFASFELPPVPHFNPPAPVEIHVKPVDFEPIKEKMEDLLSTSEEDTSFLLDEIKDLEKRADELSIQLKIELFGNDSNSKFTISDVENDIINLEKKKEHLDRIKATSIKSAREIKEQLDQTDSEIKELKARLLEVTITDEMLNEKKEELSVKEAEILEQFNKKLRLI